MSQPTQIANEHELNARFAALVRQRDNALNQNVNDFGTIEMLRAELSRQTNLVDELQSKIVMLEFQASATAAQDLPAQAQPD